MNSRTKNDLDQCEFVFSQDDQDDLEKELDEMMEEPPTSDGNQQTPKAAPTAPEQDILQDFLFLQTLTMNKYDGVFVVQCVQCQLRGQVGSRTKNELDQCEFVFSQDDQDDLEKELDKMMEEPPTSDGNQQTSSKAAPTAPEQDILQDFLPLQTLTMNKYDGVFVVQCVQCQLRGQVGSRTKNELDQCEFVFSQDDQDDLEKELDKTMAEPTTSDGNQQTPSKAAPTAPEQDILQDFLPLQTLTMKRYYGVFAVQCVQCQLRGQVGSRTKNDLDQCEFVFSQDDQDDLEKELDKMMEEPTTSEGNQPTPSKAAPTAPEQDIFQNDPEKI